MMIEIRNKIQSGYNLREIIDHVDELQFGSQRAKHVLSHLDEAKIKNMGNAGRNGGEYYTPRPLIRAVILVLKPQIGETICAGACGFAGFHCESFDYLKSSGKLTTKDLKTLQTKTFYGNQKKSLAYVIGIMNMILHGIEAPNIVHTNTLTENLADIQEKDRYDIVMANPPFGGKERPEVQQNFPIRTGETALLFLQHFIKILRHAPFPSPIPKQLENTSPISRSTIGGKHSKKNTASFWFGIRFHSMRNTCGIDPQPTSPSSPNGASYANLCPSPNGQPTIAQGAAP